MEYRSNLTQANQSTQSNQPDEQVGRWTRHEFCNYLETTLIPDLKESGNHATAEDFEVALSFMRVRNLEPAPVTMAEEKVSNAIRFLRQCKLLVTMGSISQGSRTWTPKIECLYVEPSASTGFHWVMRKDNGEKLNVSEEQVEIQLQ